MIWPLRRARVVEAERERLVADIEQTRAIRMRLLRQWPAVRSIAHALVERRNENGFGEELEVAWTPRERNGGHGSHE